MASASQGSDNTPTVTVEMHDLAPRATAVFVDSGLRQVRMDVDGDLREMIEHQDSVHHAFAVPRPEDGGLGAANSADTCAENCAEVVKDALPIGESTFSVIDMYLSLQDLRIRFPVVPEKVWDEILQLMAVIQPELGVQTLHRMDKSLNDLAGTKGLKQFVACEHCGAMLQLDQRNCAPRCEDCGDDAFLARANDTRYIVTPFHEPLIRAVNKITVWPDGQGTDSLQDITDGDLYISARQQELAEGVTKVHLMIGTDGVQPFKKTDWSLWPVLASIVELPHHVSCWPGHLRLMRIPTPLSAHSLTCGVFIVHREASTVPRCVYRPFRNSARQQVPML